MIRLPTRSTLFPYTHLFCFFFNDTATTEIYTLSLHDALPICAGRDTGRGGEDLRGDPCAYCTPQSARSRGGRAGLFQPAWDGEIAPPQRRPHLPCAPVAALCGDRRLGGPRKMRRRVLDRACRGHGRAISAQGIHRRAGPRNRAGRRALGEDFSAIAGGRPCRDAGSL